MATNNSTPSIDSDVIHKLALQSDYVARYAELAEACRLAILRANAAVDATAATGLIHAVLKDTIPLSDPAAADAGTGAEKTKNLIARSLYAAVAGAVAGAESAAAAAGPAGLAGGGAQAPPAPAPDTAAVLAQFKPMIKDHCSNALQKFRTFYNANKTNIVILQGGITDADGPLDTATVFRAFRRPQTGGKRTKKSEKKSKKSRK